MRSGQENSMMVAAGGRAAPEYDLLSGGSDLVDLAMLAARGSAAARRVSEGSPTDDDDERALRALTALFQQSARAIKAFDPRHPATPPPASALAARVDVAIDALLHSPVQAADPASLDVDATAALFERLASEAQAVLDERSVDVARALVSVLDALSVSVLRETGHVGETTSTM